MSFMGVCKELSAKITILLFSNFNTLKKTTIHVYFGNYQFPWFQTCGVFTNSCYFLVTLKLTPSKESLNFLTSKLSLRLWITQLYQYFF